MDARLPDVFLNYVVSCLPPQVPPGPQGGRKAIDHSTVLKVIWFVMTVGSRWKDVPIEMGCSGETARTRLKLWQEADVWQKVHRLILSELRRKDELQLETVMINSVQVRAFGGGDRSSPALLIAVNQAQNTPSLSM